MNDDKAFCSSFFGCFKVTLGYGLLMGGGVGDIFNVSVGQRWLLDISYFFIVNIGMLNLITGVIITTFGQLRENKARRVEDTLGVCFICGIDKQVFDHASSESDGFRTHIKIDHNMWNYLYFIFMLWEQDRDDDDGLEQYVRKAIDANEITWFPLHKAMRLERVASKAEVLRKDLCESVKQTENNVAAKFDDFQSEVSTLLHELMATLRQDSTSGAGGRLVDASVSYEEDEGFDDDLANLTEHSRCADQILSKHVSLGLSRVDGLDLAEDRLKSLSCRLLADSGILSAPNAFVEGRTLHFDESKLLPLLTNVQPTDRRTLLLQILDGDEFAGRRAMHVVAECELSLQELYPLGEGRCLFEKKFVRGEQSELCTVTLVCDVESAGGSLLASPGSRSKREFFNSTGGGTQS
jgi:hypothetical protein